MDGGREGEGREGDRASAMEGGREGGRKVRARDGGEERMQGE